MSAQFQPDAVMLTLEDGSVLRTRLLVGADGARSWVREAAGIAVSWFATPVAPAAALPNATTMAWAAAIGAVHAIAMGVDFPESNRRFARLAD